MFSNNRRVVDLSATREPHWPTTVRSRTHDGRLAGTDGSVWLYRSVPLVPIVDATNDAEIIAAGRPIQSAITEIAQTTPIRLARRNASIKSYRNLHMLLVNVPMEYRPPAGHPIFAELAADYADTIVYRRLLLFGIQLRSSYTASGIRGAIDTVVDTLVSGREPMSAYDADFSRIDQILTRSGMAPVAEEQMRLASAWWNYGRWPGTTVLPHPRHLHVFTSTESEQEAAARDPMNCTNWPSRRDAYAVTFASLRDIYQARDESQMTLVSPTESRAWWADWLLRSQALAVSIRAKIEPPRVTAKLLARGKEQITGDMKERMKIGKEAHAQQETAFSDLDELQDMYETGEGQPTLVDSAVTVAINGKVPDMDKLNADGNYVAELASMDYLQEGAMAETWLASPVRANPVLHDFAASLVSFSALPSLSKVGDKTGALAGFTERDRQPAYVSHKAASRADSKPIAMVVGETGSGKTVILQWLAYQFAKMGVPQVIFDPKGEPDMSPVVDAAGGDIASLDDLLSADGVLDPLRIANTPAAGIAKAADLVAGLNPYGSRVDELYPRLLRALKTGTDKGATATGMALKIAREVDPHLADVADPVIDWATTDPMVRSYIGLSDSASRMRLSDGLTYIRCGTGLPRPTPGTALRDQKPSERAVSTMVAQVLAASMAALAGRDGVIHMDEAWMVLSLGAQAVDEIGRTARSLRVLPMLYNQKCSEAVNAGMSGYISRGLLLHVTETEAKAACHLLGVDPTEERLARITSNSTTDPDSLRVQKDARGRVTRGSVAYYADLDGRVIPIEIKLTDEFIRIASSNPEDVDRRRREAAAAAGGVPAQ